MAISENNDVVERLFLDGHAPIWPNLTRRQKPIDFMNESWRRKGWFVISREEAQRFKATLFNVNDFNFWLCGEFKEVQSNEKSRR